MSESYNAWNEDLFYSSEVPSDQINDPENTYSPNRQYRYQSRSSSLNLTPTQERNPLQALQQTSNGLLYSPARN